MLLTIVLFIIILGILVLVHEFGHFWTARQAGIRVDEFGFGLPPRAFGIKKGDVLYSLNWIPFGGFVRIFGEEGAGRGDPASFASRPARVKLAVLLAGILGNFLLAWLLISVIQGIGVPTSIRDETEGARNIRVHIGEIAKNSPAEAIDMRAGDRLTKLIALSGEIIEPARIKEIQDFVKKYADTEMEVTFLRGEQVFVQKVVPRTQPPEGEGPLGIALMRVGIVTYPWYESWWRGFFATASLGITLTQGVIQILSDLVTGKGIAEGVAGPVGIASLTGQVVPLGISSMIQFVAVLSLNLALLNLLPIPALDGGRAAFVVAEKVIGRPVSVKAERAIHTIGFLLLITFLFWISVRDIERFF